MNMGNFDQGDFDREDFERVSLTGDILTRVFFCLFFLPKDFVWGDLPGDFD